MNLNDKQLMAANKIYMAWDLPSLDTAIPVLNATKGLLKNVKINSLYVKEGPNVIQALNDYGMNVFLDLKFYDIPGTVENHCYAATKQGVKFITVHAHGGVEMMNAAVKGASKASEELGIERPKILGITVLTSFKLEDYLQTINSSNNNVITIQSQVLNLASLANKAGIDGIVCSPKEVEAIKKIYPSLITMVPGIQGPQSGIAGATQNMDRVATPGNAVKWGADYLVIGSAIYKAKDPKQAMLEIINDIAGVI